MQNKNYNLSFVLVLYSHFSHFAIYMSFPVTTSLKVQKPLQYVVETTRGVTPASPTFINAGPIQEFTPNIETNSVNYRMLGSEDLYKVLKTGERFSFDITFNPIDKNLLSKGVNLTTDATHNREQSLTFLMSQLMYPGTGSSLSEHYIIAKGCSCDSTSIDISLEAVNISQTWIANDIPIPTTTHGLTTPTFASAITAAPWTGITAGSNSLTFGGDDYILRGFSCTVSHNTDQFQPIGEANVFATIPTIRDISGSFDVLHSGTDLQADTEAVVPRAATVKLSTDTKITFTDMYLTSYNETISATATEAKTVSYNFVAKSAVVEAI
jgi:hypothetical protein